MFGATILQAQAAAQSLLAWQPGDPPPPIQVVADDLLPAEAGPCPATPPYAARLCRFSALDEALAGPPDGAHAAARAALRARLAPFLRAAPTNCDPAPGAPVLLFTHADAVQTRQALLTELHGGRDLMPAGARRDNPSLADQACPLRRSDAPPDPAQLKAALGQDAAFGRAVVLTLDNRVNPFRWDAPINQVRHHEQPSFSLLLPLRPAAIARTVPLLQAAFAGRPAPRLLIDYDLTLDLADLRAAMGEAVATDMPGVNEATGTDLFSTSLRNTARYIAQIGPDSAEAVHLARYVATRLLVPCVQVSLAVNFQQDAAHWRDAEFMLAGLDEAASGTDAFRPVGDPRFVPFAIEGGDNGHAAWNRLRLDAFAPPLMDQLQQGIRPVVQGAYAKLPDGTSHTRLHGVIDLAAYARIALRAHLYPGSGASWNGAWHSSLTSDGRLGPDEHPAINTLALVIEVHGPFIARLRVDRLQLSLQPEDTAGQHAAARRGAARPGGSPPAASLRTDRAACIRRLALLHCINPAGTISLPQR